MTESSLGNGACTCICFKKVSHRELEILYHVARMHTSYIKHCKEDLKRDYLPCFTAQQALEAFLVMIGEKNLDEVSEKGVACYNSMIANAKKK